MTTLACARQGTACSDARRPMAAFAKSSRANRQLTEKCRDTARMTLWDNERGRLLTMAQVWDAIWAQLEARCGSFN
jgi:hypothetical protein